MNANDVKQVTASGTAYSVTNADAAVDFGTTDPSLVLRAPGTWLIFARVNVKYNAATFAASRTLTLQLYRTNNTAASIVSTTLATDIITTKTYTEQVVMIPPYLYTTTNNDDTVTIYAGLNTAPTAGSLDVTEANIIAVRLY